MLSSEGEATEIQARGLVCSSSMKPAVMICLEEGCTAHPLLCCDEECPCQAPHELHLQHRLKVMLKKIQEKSDDFTEVKQA